MFNRACRKTDHAFAKKGMAAIPATFYAALLCQFQVSVSDICDNHDIHPTPMIDRSHSEGCQSARLPVQTEKGLIIPHEARLLTRMIAREFDTYSLSDTGHSYAT